MLIRGLSGFCQGWKEENRQKQVPEAGCRDKYGAGFGSFGRYGYNGEARSCRSNNTRYLEYG